jgi:hypothetical protein
MVKNVSFHNSSFALRFFKCKWQGHSVTHPLFNNGISENETPTRASLFQTPHLLQKENAIE